MLADTLFDNPADTGLDPVPGESTNDAKGFQLQILRGIGEAYGQAWQNACQYLIGCKVGTFTQVTDAIPEAFASWTPGKANPVTWLRTQVKGVKSKETKQLVLVKRGKGRIFGQTNGLTKDRLAEIRNATKVSYVFLDGGEESDENAESDTVNPHELVKDENAEAPDKKLTRAEMIALCHRAVSNLPPIDQLVFRLSRGWDCKKIGCQVIARLLKTWGIKPGSPYGVTLVEQRARDAVKRYVRASLAGSAKEIAGVKIRGNMVKSIQEISLTVRAMAK